MESISNCNTYTRKSVNEQNKSSMENTADFFNYDMHVKTLTKDKRQVCR